MDLLSLPESTAYTVRTPDGLAIAAQVWGNPHGQEILFIHGFSQSHLSWMNQFDSQLSETFRIATYDFRGNGSSDKPLEPEFYRDSRLWADELKAVVNTLQLRRPVVVAWSYGGRILCDYLSHFGTDQLAGIVFVAATTKSDPQFRGDVLKRVLPQMVSDDLVTNIIGTGEFLRAVTTKPMKQQEFETALAFNMVTPAPVRRFQIGRNADYEKTLSSLNVPVLVIHGLDDRMLLPESSRYLASTVPNAKALFYEGVGHAPFIETPERFNDDVISFVLEADPSKH